MSITILIAKEFLEFKYQRPQNVLFLFGLFLGAGWISYVALHHKINFLELVRKFIYDKQYRYANDVNCNLVLEPRECTFHENVSASIIKHNRKYL